MVRAYVGPAVRIMAVIKANGYGHGMLHLAGEAVAAGITDLGVARVHEGLELRRAGFGQRVLVFEAASRASLEAAIGQDLILTVTGDASVALIEDAARATGKRAAVHVKVDTGMGRLGVPAGEAAGIVTRVARSPVLTLDGVYSHFATSEETDRTFALVQLERFHGLLAQLEHAGVQIPVRHMANSGAIIALPESYLDMVRPGIMLYGYTPGRGMSERHPVRPVLSLLSHVAFVKTVPPGVPISYNRRHYTGRETTIATVPMGYGDGYSRLLTGRAQVLIRGERYPVVGTICMDQLMVDLGPGSDIAVGEDVVFIGESGGDRLTAWDVAGLIGSIPYETTCALTPRIPRIIEGCR